MAHDASSLLRQIPSVAVLLESAPLRRAVAQYGRATTVWSVRRAVAALRREIQSDPSRQSLPSLAELSQQIAASLADAERTGLRRLINATGILLHTGAGRAPLASQAIQAMADVAAGYCNVEIDLTSGQRTVRSCSVEDLLRQLTGAEAAHIVNNNAGATGLVLAALSTNREVVVSHGELIEIGGGFRLPDVITTFGARLRPVGTTNKTRAKDYADAIGPETGALLAVHPSNYYVAGFTESTPLAQLAVVARQHGVPLVHDIGSGALIDFAQFGLHGEPIARQSLQQGADLVLFSGDKLLGGPQCGIVVGRADLVARVMRHPLNRALRVDKLTLAALRATLELYRRPEQAAKSIPLLQLVAATCEQLRQRAEELVGQLGNRLGDWRIRSESDEAFLGGGSLPGRGLPSWSVAVSPTRQDSLQKVEHLARRLRMGEPPVVGRVSDDALIFCLHAVFPHEDEQLGKALQTACNDVT